MTPGSSRTFASLDFNGGVSGASPGRTGAKEKAGGEQARLFIALWPEAEVARSIRAWCSKCTGVPGSLQVAPERLHLTLIFLGNVQRQRMPELVQALRLPFRPFELTFSRCEKWRHGLVVAPPDAIPQLLVDLHAVLREALRLMGLPFEDREFRPHLTLARRYSQALPEQAGPSVRWPVNGYVLVESRSIPRLEYQLLHRYR